MREAIQGEIIKFKLAMKGVPVHCLMWDVCVAFFDRLQ